MFSDKEKKRDGDGSKLVASKIPAICSNLHFALEKEELEHFTNILMSYDDKASLKDVLLSTLDLVDSLLNKVKTLKAEKEKIATFNPLSSKPRLQTKRKNPSDLNQGATFNDIPHVMMKNVCESLEPD